MLGNVLTLILLTSPFIKSDGYDLDDFERIERNLDPNYRTGSNGAGSTKFFIKVHICLTFWAHLDYADCPVKVDHAMDMLRNYGCNCFPSNFDDIPVKSGAQLSWHMGNNGKPLDEIDYHCKKLHDAYKCIQMDADDGKLEDPKPSGTNPMDKCSKYVFIDVYFDKDNLILYCGKKNNLNYENTLPQDLCRLRACQIEMHFAKQVFMLIGNDPRIYEDNHPGMYNIFDDTNVCKLGKGFRTHDCCGFYPERYPYHEGILTCCENSNELHLVGEC